jgi:hypothetical protein
MFAGGLAAALMEEAKTWLVHGADGANGLQQKKTQICRNLQINHCHSKVQSKRLAHPIFKQDETETLNCQPIYYLSHFTN